LGAVIGAAAMHGAGDDAHAEVGCEVVVPADADIATGDTPWPLGLGLLLALGRGNGGVWLCENDPGGGRDQQTAHHGGRNLALAEAHRSSLPLRWCRPPCPTNVRAYARPARRTKVRCRMARGQRIESDFSLRSARRFSR